MKLSELKSLNQFLSSLFIFFKKNNIYSCLDEIDDYDELLKNLLASDFVRFSYISDIKTFIIDFNIKFKVDMHEVYMFIFGNEVEEKDSSLIVDLSGEDNLNFISIDFNNEKYLPFVKDFVVKEGILPVTDYNGEKKFEYIDKKDVMTFREFKTFLKNNPKAKDVKWIDVDGEYDEIKYN